MANNKPTKRVLRADDAESSVRLSRKNIRSDDKKTVKESKSSNFFGRITPAYLISSWNELKLVTWPNRKETRQLTTAVLIFAIIVGGAVSIVDLLLDKVFKKVILKQ